ncbi:MAG: DUF4193 family protein [Acidimicrobiales bacterium]
MADDLDDVAAPEDLEDLDEEALEIDDDAVADDDLGDELGEVELDEDEEGDGVVAVVEAAPATTERSTEEADEEEEEEPEDEDVEASLDVILKERLVVEDEVEDEELAEVDDRSGETERVLPKQPDEFVCRSCFLVKHPSQLADKKKMLCRDCV